MINVRDTRIAIKPEQLAAMNTRIKSESRRLDELSTNLRAIILGLDWQIRATPIVAAKILSLTSQITQNANMLRTHSDNAQFAYDRLRDADAHLSASIREIAYIMNNFSANSRTASVAIPCTDLNNLSRLI